MYFFGVEPPLPIILMFTPLVELVAPTTKLVVEFVDVSVIVVGPFVGPVPSTL